MCLCVYVTVTFNMHDNNLAYKNCNLFTTLTTTIFFLKIDIVASINHVWNQILKYFFPNFIDIVFFFIMFKITFVEEKSFIVKQYNKYCLQNCCIWKINCNYFFISIGSVVWNTVHLRTTLFSALDFKLTFSSCR